MKKILLICLIFLTSCSSDNLNTRCRRAFILESIVELSRNSIAENNKDDTLLSMCLLSKIYKEQEDTINQLYDSWHNDKTYFYIYFKWQMDECRKKNYDLQQVLDESLKAKDFADKHKNTKCENALGKKLVSK